MWHFDAKLSRDQAKYSWEQRAESWNDQWNSLFGCNTVRLPPGGWTHDLSTLQDFSKSRATLTIKFSVSNEYIFDKIFHKSTKKDKTQQKKLEMILILPKFLQWISLKIKLCASSPWLFGPNSAWGSKVTKTIRKTHPTLIDQKYALNWS